VCVYLRVSSAVVLIGLVAGAVSGCIFCLGVAVGVASCLSRVLVA
jgi:hypothetical protein